MKNQEWVLGAMGQRLSFKDPNLWQGHWLVSPTKLKDGSWGVWLDNPEAIKGDGIVIQTKSGKQWEGTLIEREKPDSNKWSYLPTKKHGNLFGGAGTESPEDLDYYNEIQSEFSYLALPQS